MNVSRSIPDIIGTKTITDDGSDLTITVNGSRNCVTTNGSRNGTERPGNGYGSGLGYKRVGQEPQTSLMLSLLHMLSYFLLNAFVVFLKERVVSCFHLGLQQLAC